MWARIENNIVREIINVDPSGRYSPSLTWVPCSDTIKQGYIYDPVNSSFSEPVEDSFPLTAMARVDEAYEALASSGVDPTSLFSRANNLAKQNLAINIEFTKLIGNLRGRWSPVVIAGTEACIASLRNEMNSAGDPITQNDIDWVNNWITTYNLGLTLLS